jgi:hypothetical protein
MAVAVPASTILPIRLAIWVTTRATRDEIGTIVERTAGETALSVRVRAIPEKGKANFAAQNSDTRRIGNNITLKNIGDFGSGTRSDTDPISDRTMGETTS